MKTLFDPMNIGGMKVKNRLVRSATWEGMCDPDGRPTAKLADCYHSLAEGGVGLLITGYAFVLSEGRQSPCMIGMHTDAFIPELRTLAAAVHEKGGKICAQLVHTGGQTTSKIIGRQPYAPSAVKVAQFFETPAELTAQEIAGVVAAFGAAARRARDCGFDAVQLHAAHGYLINQFLSPLTNRRTDDYGGGIENRSRFLREVYLRVRADAGADFPVLVKLNGIDNLDGGLSAADALHAAAMLDREGVDAIEVSGGTPASGPFGPVRVKIDRPDQEAYNAPLAAAIKSAVRCPVMSVGGFRSYDVAETVITRGEADFISLARPLIREPNLPKRWQSGDHGRATCISCNGCFKAGLKGGIFCVKDDKSKKSGAAV